MADTAGFCSDFINIFHIPEKNIYSEDSVLDNVY